MTMTEEGIPGQELTDQLSSYFGDRYTIEQATYGASQTSICP